MSDQAGADGAATPAALPEPDPFAELRRALVDESPERPRLAWRHATVLRLRFGLHDGVPKTLEQIGYEFGVTKERIRQIENRSLAALGLEHLRSPAAADPAGSTSPEPGYRRLHRVADIPGDGDGIRVWFRGAWRAGQLRRRYQRVCDMLVDMGHGEPVQTRLPVTCIAIPAGAEPGAPFGTPG